MRGVNSSLHLAFACTVAVLASTGAFSQGVGFRDDFTGSDLRPEWAIVGENKDRWTLIDGEYLLIITDHPPSNVLIYQGNLPDNYGIVSKITADLLGHNVVSHNSVSLGIVENADNWIKLTAAGDTMSFTKLLKGDRSDISKEIGAISGDFWLQMVKEGVEFEAMYSFDGSTWTSMGKQFFIGLDGRPTVESWNHQRDGYQKIADTGVRVDYVEITPR